LIKQNQQISTYNQLNLEEIKSSQLVLNISSDTVPTSTQNCKIQIKIFTSG
jgi:hypothetical protein